MIRESIVLKDLSFRKINPKAFMDHGLKILNKISVKEESKVSEFH